MKTLLRLCGIFAALIACSSEPPKPAVPDWTHQPTRIVDGGYIVYIGSGHSPDPDRAEFKAEGQALEDIANECSFIPKGARVEDRFVQKDKYESTAYAKVALEFQECDGAQHAIDPEDVRKLASTGFTEQLKKYQDLMETGEMPPKAELAENDEIQPPPAPPSGGTGDSTHFFVVRQYVAYQKEIVILSPPATYAPNTPATQGYVAAVQPASQQIAAVQKESPAVRNTAWSSLPQRPVMMKPASLAPRNQAKWAPMRAPHNPGPGKRPGPPPPKRKRRGHWNQSKG